MLLAALLAATTLGFGPSGPTVAAGPRWAPLSTATIHPGVQLVTNGSQCTSNFVFGRGYDVLIGMAAHCASTGGPTDTNGCTTKSLPVGTRVTIEGATRPGVLVYSSWIAMQQARERNASACASNDFALVRIDRADLGRVNPSVPHWGGPRGLNTTGFPAGANAYTYGDSDLRLGIRALSPKSGKSLGTDRGGWSHQAYTVSPGVPGDSGSALLDGQGRATGVLSTVAVTPLPASNRYSDLARAMGYAASKGFTVQLLNGTLAFSGSRVPLDL